MNTIQIIIDNNNQITLQDAVTACYYPAYEARRALADYDALTSVRADIRRVCECADARFRIETHGKDGDLLPNGFRFGDREAIVSIISSTKLPRTVLP